jgi:transposase-like protein
MTEPTSAQDLFKGRHFDQEIIVLCVRWYLAFKLSSRDLVQMMAERGITLSHTTILRWVQQYVPEFEKRWNHYARPVGNSWRVDETYIKVRGQWVYLYRAVDKEGRTVDFLLSKRRDVATAKRFFSRAAKQHGAPRVITLDGYAASPSGRDIVKCCVSERGASLLNDWLGGLLGLFFAIDELNADIDRLIDTYTDGEIADLLNERGVRTVVITPWTAARVGRLRAIYRLTDRSTRLLAQGLLTPEDVAARYGVVLSTVHLWRRRGLLRAHPINDRGDYLYEIPPEDLPAKYAHKREYQVDPVTSSPNTLRGAV